MPRGPVPLQSYQHRSQQVSAERLINLCAEMEPRSAKSPVVAITTPGLTSFAMPAVQAPSRGRLVMGSFLYTVIGPTVYKVAVDGTMTPLGTITSGAAVSMAHNGIQLAIVVPESGEGWIATSSTLTQITDPYYLGATAVTCIDGFFIFSEPNTTTFFISDLNDGTTGDPLAFASAEGSPDNLVAPIRVGRELWLFGETSVEIWNNTGGSPMPFSRITGAYVDRGTAARFSIAPLENRVYWLGDDRIVYRNNGANPERISTHAIEQAIAGYGTASDARGWIYTQEGHTYYVLSFINAGETLVYDITAQSWHERDSEEYGTWRCIDGGAFAGAIIGHDALNGALYVIDPTAYSEDGEEIIRTAITPPLSNEGRLMVFHALQLDMETGTGLQAGQGSDPQIWLSYSDDGGRTWSDQIQGGFGRVGAYKTRVTWNRLGSAYERVFKFEWSDPVRTVLIGINMMADTGR